MTSTILVRLAAAASPIIDAGRGLSEHSLPETPEAAEKTVESNAAVDSSAKSPKNDEEPKASLATVEANGAAGSSVKSPKNDVDAKAPLASVEANGAADSFVKPPEEDEDANGDTKESEVAKKKDSVEASVSDECKEDSLPLKRPAAAIETPPVTPKRRRSAKSS